MSFFVDLIHFFEGKLAFSFIHLLTSCLSQLIVFIWHSVSNREMVSMETLLTLTHLPSSVGWLSLILNSQCFSFNTPPFFACYYPHCRCDQEFSRCSRLASPDLFVAPQRASVSAWSARKRLFTEASRSPLFTFLFQEKSLTETDPSFIAGHSSLPLLLRTASGWTGLLWEVIKSV